MRTIIRMLVCVSLVGGVVKAATKDSATEQRRSDLTAALRELNAQPPQDSYQEHPGWHKSEVREKLKGIVTKYPNSEEAITAELWLATVELETGQAASGRAKKGESMLSVASTFERVIKSSPHSWQAKAAHVGRASALFGAKRWDEFRAEAGDILTNTAEYRAESNTGYLEFLRAHKMSGADVEPEFRWMMIVAASCEEKASEAIALAEDLQSKFPEWSAKRKLGGTIELLKSGKKPFGC
jgi:hypothetical protein